MLQLSPRAQLGLGQRLLRYGPLNLQSMAFYIALTAILHSAVLAMTQWRSGTIMDRGHPYE